MKTARLLATSICTLTIASSTLAQPLDQETRDKGLAIADRAIAYLMSQQDPQTGGFSVDPRPDAYQFPAITGLVLQGAALDDDFNPNDPKVKAAVNFILSFQQPDGGIYDRVLASYNTAICVSALAAINKDQYKTPYITPAVRFLRTLQWSEDAADRDDTGAVDRDHPFYGGVGYGRNNRPDNSNLNLMLQALHDAGVPSEDPAYQRALVFLQRTQMLDPSNDMPYANGSNQGGFIYATSPDGANLGIGESKAGTIEEDIEGVNVSRLRAYGSMTYAGFKSFAYAGLSANDPRVVAARTWLERNYTMEENPGLGTDGQYYYYMTLGRALEAWGDGQMLTRNTLRMSGGHIVKYDTLTEQPTTYELTTLTAKDGTTLNFDHPIKRWTAWLKPQPEGAIGQLVPTFAGESHQTGPHTTIDNASVTFRNVALSPLNDQRDPNSMQLGFHADAHIERSTDWRTDLINKLASLQNTDGSFRVLDDRWMESNHVLITAYALIGLQAAIDTAGGL